jgi:hypothetical protein
MRIILLLVLLGSLLKAAPSTDLGQEIQVPLEGIDGFALIDKDTGEIRIITVSADGKVLAPAAYHSGLPAVTGATSGIMDGANETLILASATSSRLTLFNTVSSETTDLFPAGIGPQFPAYVRKAPAGPDDLATASTFNSGGDSLSLYRDPADSFTALHAVSELSEITCLQPFFTAPGNTRYAAGVENKPAGAELFTVAISAGNKIRKTASHPVSENTVLASNVRRQDNTLMLVGYVRGSTSVSLIPVSAAPALDVPVEVTLPFPAGSIAPADPGGAGPAGILVTSIDGKLAAHYEITRANKLELVQEFLWDGNALISGLVPVPGKGIMTLSGETSRSSTQFEFHSWDGSQWQRKDAGQLPGSSLPDPEFATLFWFSAEPLVDPNAALLKLEANSDWASKSANAPIPANIITETYLDQESGLGNPVVSIPSTPPGASHLLTNQYLDSVSLSALASNSALSIPSLAVTPQSGTYAEPVQATVDADDDLYAIWYRENVFGASWKPYVGPVTVSYTSEWQFYASGIGSGINSPIVSRSYLFNLEDVTGFDSDNDLIPDFVERAQGLDPNGGADSDSDGFTDLDELLNGSNPTNNASTPADPSYPFNGEGFMILAQAFDNATGEASEGEPDSGDIADEIDGVPIDLHGITSNLLASAPVRALTEPASLSGQLAATIRIGTPVAAREWVILNSPQYFDLDGPDPRTRGGRDIYKVIQRPIQDPPTISPVLNGLDIDSDAAAWIADATDAFNNHEQVDSITTLRPVDSALAVLAETAIYNALGNLEASEQDALDVPRDTEDETGRSRFTLFGNRAGDAARTALSPAMYQALLTDGLSLENLLSTLKTTVSSSAAIETLCNALYGFHVDHSEPTAAETDVIPLLPLPIDALRVLLSEESLPGEYDGAVSAATLQAAQTAMHSALNLLGSAYRPTETWTVEVAAPLSPSQDYSYTNLVSGNPVAFFEADGDSLSLDKGLGLALGMRFSVTGYTDINGPAGHDALELLSLNVVSVPAATDTDLDGDLLDDEWEKFFFGDTASVSTYGTHPAHGYTYLQLFLIGHDPRDECEEAPEEPRTTPAPGGLDIERLQSGEYAISFSFPDTYFDAFDFNVEQSVNLAQFTSLAASGPLKTAVNQYRINVGVPASSLPKNLFRLVMTLATD